MKKMLKNTNRTIKREVLMVALLLALLAMMLPTVTAQIAIESFAATPKTLPPRK